MGKSQGTCAVISPTSMDICRCFGLRCMWCGQSSVYHRPCHCVALERKSERIDQRRRAHPMGDLLPLACGTITRRCLEPSLMSKHIQEGAFGIGARGRV
eukprot:5060506-Prymnesium_polylepis.1